MGIHRRRPALGVLALLLLLLVACSADRPAPIAAHAPAIPADAALLPRPAPIDDGGASALPSTPPDAAPKQPEWTEAAPGDTILMFRDVMVGELPSPTRNTWTLILSKSQPARALVRIEMQQGVRHIKRLDRTTHFAESWRQPGVRVEYAGAVTRKAPLSITLERTFGPEDATPRTMALDCASKDINVHPDFAALVEGWKYNDDSMEPACWAPPRTERVRATACKVAAEPALTFGFTEGLHFVVPKKKTEKEENAGVEWVFINSDMVIQEGGFRWIPAFWK